MAGLTALYDSCVLYPAPLRDLLVRLAGTGLFRARWTNAIHEEWIYGVLENRSDLTRERLERSVAAVGRGVVDDYHRDRRPERRLGPGERPGVGLDPAGRRRVILPEVNDADRRPGNAPRASFPVPGR